VWVNERNVGLIVDEVIDVVSLSLDDAVPSKDILPEGLGEIAVLIGVIQDEIGTVLLINIDRLFISDSGRILKQAISTISEFEGTKTISESAVQPFKEAPVELSPSPSCDGEVESPPDSEVTTIEGASDESPTAQDNGEQESEMPVNVEAKPSVEPDGKEVAEKPGPKRRGKPKTIRKTTQKKTPRKKTTRAKKTPRSSSKKGEDKT
jgi:hypothetical protein